MGKTVKGYKDIMFGSTKHEKNIPMLTKDQKRFLSDVLTRGTSQKAKRAYQGYLEDEPEINLDKLLKPSKQTYKDLMNQGSGMDAFKSGVVDPMMLQYSQQVLPAVQQRFADMNAGSSSALNQALAASANDLTTQMSANYIPFMQGQQATRLAAAQGYASLSNPYVDLYKQAQSNRLNALSGLGSLAGQHTFTPLISQREGIAGPLIGAGGSIGAAMMSSRNIKKNIREYGKGLEEVRNLDVKIYDYKEDFGGSKNRVGVIAEDVPKEVTTEVNGVLAVDLYGLIGLIINSVKELDKKIEKLGEAK